MHPDEIRNPESVTPKEAAIFDDMKIKIHKLLDDLKNKNLLKKPSKNQIDAFLKILEMNDRHSENYNILTKIMEDPNKTQQFLQNSSKYGINQNNFPEIYIFIL